MTQTATEPTGVAQVLTPSGVEIYYQSGPKRLYRVRSKKFKHVCMGGLEGNCARDCGYVKGEWVEVPSVSTVLGVLDKPALVWWGQRVGIEGVLSLYRISGVTEIVEACLWDSNAEALVDLLKEHKLTVNHQRDKAADRGTNVHSALEGWAETGVTPDPRFFPENERGYVQGLVNFINDAHPHPLQSEVMVASLDGFAGRFDLLANLDFAGNVVTKTYPKREDVRSEIGGAWLLDLKTSKDVYPSYHLQLAAYMRGLMECGYDAPDHAGVVRVTDDGRYELVECRAIYEDFKRVLDAHNSIERIKGK